MDQKVEEVVEQVEVQEQHPPWPTRKTEEEGEQLTEVVSSGLGPVAEISQSGPTAAINQPVPQAAACGPR